MIKLEPNSNVDLTISIKETFMIFMNIIASLNDLDGDGDGGGYGLMMMV